MGKYLKIVKRYEKSADKDSQPGSQPSPRRSPGRQDFRQDVQQISELAAVIDAFSQKDGSKTFCLTSSRSGEGVSSVSANVARFMAVTHPIKKILLLDCNLQNPVQHAVFDIPESPGLCDILVRNSTHSECVHKVSPNGLHIMPYGRAGLNMVFLLENGQLSALIDEAKKSYDLIFIDCPAVLESAYSLMIANVSDIVFFIVQANRTQWEVARRAKTSLQEHGCNIGGVVLNRVLKVIPSWIYNSL
jgi:capsular exopolysaccharide synthesis family protein